MSFGHRIRQLRQSRGVTQSELGGPELSKSFISLLEKDRAQPSVETLVLLARRLETSIDSLLGQTGNIPEMVCEGLLQLSREAISGRRFDEAERYVGVVSFLSDKYRLSEASREGNLQEGEIALEQRNFGLAWAKLEAARGGAEQSKDEWRVGRALLLMGRSKLRQREFPAAITLLEKCVTALRRAKASRDPARVEALIALGTTLVYMGDYPAAIRKYGEAAKSDVAQHNLKLRGRALWGIGWAERKLGKFDSAREYLLKARDVFEQAEDLLDLMRVLKNIGELLHEQGKSREALRFLHHALRVANRVQTPVVRASTHTEIGRINVSLGNLDDGEHFAQLALEEAVSVNDPVEVAEAKVVLAQIHARRGDIPAGIDMMKDAVDIFRARKMRGKIAVVARELGLLLRARGSHAQAAEYLALSLEHTQSTEGAPRATAEVSE